MAVGVLLSVQCALAAAPRITARAAVVMDAKTGEVLWSKNADQKRSPASTTKIVTTMLALESGRLNESFKVSSRAQKQVASKLHLRKGQRVTLRDLTYSLMLKSANDGAVVVAEGLGGSVEKFSKSMEARARKAGATKTSFRNPSGLTHAKHLSTARDLGKITRAALRVPGFRKVAGTQSRKIRIRGKKTKTTTIRNKNRLVRGYFASVIGKTGYTRAAGRCFAGAAAFEGREAIVVILGSKDLWGDTKKLIEWVHRGDGASQWPRVQMAKAKSSSGKKKTAKATKRKPTVVAKAKPPAAKPAVVVKAKPAPKPAVVARPAARPTSTRVSSTGRGLSPETLARVEKARLESRSANSRTREPEPPARVASVHRSRLPQTYARFYEPRGNIRRGCTGSGCGSASRSTR